MTDRPLPELCHGLEEIGEHLGLTHRQVKHLHEQKHIPTFKIGRNVCALRSKLNAWLDQQAAGGAK